AKADGFGRDMVRWLDTIAVFLLCASLFIAVLAFGGVQRWSMSVLQLSAALLLALWTVRSLLVANPSVVKIPLFYPMVAFAALIVCQLIFGVTVYPHDT